MAHSKKFNRHRRQQQMRRRIILAGTIFMVIAVILSCSIQNAKEKQIQAASAAEQVNTPKKAKSKLKIDKQETEQERLERVKKEAKANGYPEKVIQLLDKNPETVQFVEDYAGKKDTIAADTIGESYIEGQIPQLLQWDERWGYSSYGTSNIAVSGCGPTCMAMVISGLTKDPSITPAKVAAYGTEHEYVDENNDTYWAFMKEAPSNWNVSCYDGRLTEEEIKNELQAGHPVICSVGPGDFTQNGHFIVLTSYNNGVVTVNDPFSQKNSDKVWNYADIADQIKAMWVYSVQ